jgi:hypothetical protein
MHIPSADIVRFILLRTLRQRRVVSQEELVSILSRELGKAGEYRISGRRARLIASETEGVRIVTLTRKGPAPERCPSCSGPLSRRYITNLRGRKVLAGLSCRRCGYRGSGHRFAPLRYDFELAGSPAQKVAAA